MAASRVDAAAIETLRTPTQLLALGCGPRYETAVSGETTITSTIAAIQLVKATDGGRADVVLVFSVYPLPGEGGTKRPCGLQAVVARRAQQLAVRVQDERELRRAQPRLELGDRSAH